jgi:hypothetical protein
MPTSEEQKIINAIVARMGEISTSTTYTDPDGDVQNFETNIGAKVEEERLHWDQDDDLANGAISVFQEESESEEVADQGGRLVLRTFPVRLQVFIKQLATPALTAAFGRKCISDVMAAIRTDDKWIVDGSSLAKATREVAHGLNRVPETFEVNGAYVRISIEYYCHKFSMAD